MSQAALPSAFLLTIRNDDQGPFGPVVNGTRVVVFYEYRPNHIAAMIFVCLFGIVTLAHLVRMFMLRAWFMFPFLLGGICETFGYYGRFWSHRDPNNSNPFILQNVLLLVGIPFLAATVYMSLGRMAVALRAQDISFLSPRWMTKLYVLIDIGCIFSQLMGAMMPASGKPEDITKGRTILIIGLITQIAALSFFILNTEFLNRKLTQRARPGPDWQVNHNKFFRILEGVTFLLIIRSVVRSVEFLQGSDGFIITHEIFIYLFDATLVSIAMIVLLVVHPGQLMNNGKDNKRYYVTCDEEIGLGTMSR
ncbi:protoporphyrin uptake protein 1 [Fusarium oxysporum]|nr:protoporphyrin uptake protein 1 [Fusarium oxysporum]